MSASHSGKCFPEQNLRYVLRNFPFQTTSCYCNSTIISAKKMQISLYSSVCFQIRFQPNDGDYTPLSQTESEYWLPFDR